MVKNRKLSRAISDLGWRSFRTMLIAKGEIYGREIRVINRWGATSQICSCCGFKGGKKELSVRKWTCLNCGEIHDRDINASANILKVAGGQLDTQGAPSNGDCGLEEGRSLSPWIAPQNGRGEKVRLSHKKAHFSEASTIPQYKQLSLF